jgi:hypothetical protein
MSFCLPGFRLRDVRRWITVTCRFPAIFRIIRFRQSGAGQDRQALTHAFSQEIHVLYIDGDFDDSPPDARRSQSAAACAVWLLTNNSPFWAGPVLRPSQVTMIGWTNGSRSGQTGINSVSLADIRHAKPREVAQQVLQSVPASASLVVHFDIDCLQSREMPAAYFPHTEGMTLPEVGAPGRFPERPTDHRNQRVCLVA